MTTYFKGRPLSEHLAEKRAKCAAKGHKPERVNDCDDVPASWGCICKEIVAGKAWRCARCGARVEAP